MQAPSMPQHITKVRTLPILSEIAPDITLPIMVPTPKKDNPMLALIEEIPIAALYGTIWTKTICSAPKQKKPIK
ncbi:hypothetical protein ES703_115707 [subsurface metagenome]